MSKTVEAVLKISSKLGSMAALSTMSKQLTTIHRQAQNFNRAQSAMFRTQATAAAAMSRVIVPGAMIYGGARALTAFADQERALTRTGLKIGATRAEMQGLLGDASQAAKKVGLLTSDVVETIDAYAETGAGLRDIKDDIGTITEAQQALGADGRDIVNVWDAARKSFGLMSADAKRFYGAIGAGGAAGKFEGSDMARHFPSLLPVASTAGMKGMEGIDRLVAFAEVMRDFVGTSEEAATSIGDFLTKIDSPDVQRNFSKMGIDLEKRLGKARENGEDILTVMRDVMREATKGDSTKLTKLFGDKEARRGARVVLEEMDRIRAAQDAIARNAPTVIDKNNQQLLKDARTDLDLLSDAYDRLIKSAGKQIAETGVGKVMSGAADKMDQAGAINKQLEKEGRSWLARRKWWLLHGFDTEEQGVKAIDGGYPIGGLPDLSASYPGKFPLVTPSDVPIPLPRPARAGEAGYIPSFPPHAGPMGPENTFETKSREDKLREAAKANAADLGFAIEEGGAQAGDKIKTGHEQGGQRAADALREAGDYVAAKILSAVSNIRISVPSAPGGGRANADVGKQGDDMIAVP